MNVTIVDESMDVLTGSYILMASWVFCFVIIGCVHRDQPPPPILPQEIPYAEKYYMAFQQFPVEKLDEERIKSLEGMYVKEETDKGTVIMCYNSTTEAFHYWSDNDISFASLDAVAQLYSLVHNCKALCTDYNTEYNKARDMQHEQQTNIKLTPTKVLDGPYATFKSYKTTRVKRNQRAIIPEKTNHFRKCGTLAVWDTQSQKHTPGQWSATSVSDTGRVLHKHITENQCNSETLTYTDWVSRKDKKV